MSAHTYELWARGERLAKYKTLAQALLGAVWRSEKQGFRVYVYKSIEKGGRIVAFVGASGSL